MGTQVVRRGPRTPAPVMPAGEIPLEGPPAEPRIAPTGLLQRLLPIVMLLASVGFVVVIGLDNPTSWLFGGMIALSTLGMVAGGSSRGGAQRRAESDAERADYLRYLAQIRRRARTAAAEQRASLEWTHPDPDALLTLARGPRTWERRPGDADFAHVRVGRGAQRLATALVPPQTGPVEDLEPVTTVALRRFVRTHSVVEALPTAVSLRAFAAVGVSGPAEVERRRAVVRALVAQLVTFHGPDDLLLAVVARGEGRGAWEWCKWLPHVAHPRVADGAGPMRMIGSSLAAVRAWLAPELADRPRFTRGAAPPAGAAHVVVVLDGAQGLTADDGDRALVEDGLAGVTLLDVGGGAVAGGDGGGGDSALDGLVGRRGLRLVLGEDLRGGERIGAGSEAAPGGVEWFGRPDGLAEAEAEALARRLSPCRTPGATRDEAGPATPGLLELLGVDGEPDTFDVAGAWRPRTVRERLRVPFGVGEDGEPVELDLKEAAQEGMGPHGLCVGATGSGKSELLRTLVLGLITTHSSAALNLVLVDFKGGATFAGLAALPHVGTVAGRGDTDLVRRVVAEVAGILAGRERWFREHGLTSAADLRARRRRGEDLAGDDGLGDVVLVIDGWHAFRADHEALESTVISLATAGLSYGVHVAIAVSRWAELRPALKDLLGTRVELRLDDPGESEVDRRVAATVPAGRPGRGLAPDRHHVLVAVPSDDSVAAVAAAWHGPAVPPVRLLPERVDVSELPGPGSGERHLLPIGVDEDRLAPVLLDVAADPHLVVYADGESGKTSLLRLIAHQVVTRYTPEQARLVIVDYRRGLLGAVDSEHLISYTSSAEALTAAVTDLLASLRRRLPGPDVTPEQLRARSWWTGPEVFLLVDDYDLVATPSGNPLAPLVDLLAQAKDIGLHLVVARRAGGSARAMFEPVLTRLRELATPGLVGNGSRDEGPLVGSARPGPRPPGRAVLVTRRHGETLVQLAWRDPDTSIRAVPDDAEGGP